MALVLGNSGNNVLNGFATDDAVLGFAGNDTLNGFNGDDGLAGGAGADVANGGNGNDGIDGGTGDDVLSGGNGDDLLVGAEGNDELDGGSGNDELNGGDGDDDLDGGANDDDVDGGEGDDNLLGNLGNDVLRGGLGDDILDGGSGTDTLFGGGPDASQQDVFDFDFTAHTVVGAARDVIADFNDSAFAGEDLIDLATIDADTTSALSAFSAVFLGTGQVFTAAAQIRISVDPFNVNNRIVQLNTDLDTAAEAEIMVLNVTNLTAADFIL